MTTQAAFVGVTALSTSHVGKQYGFIESFYPLPRPVERRHPRSSFLGPRRIEQLAPGDIIFSWNAEEQRLVEREVRQLLQSHATTICTLQTEAGEIRGVTPSHPFFIVERDMFLALRDVPKETSFLAFPPESSAQARIVRTLSLSIHESPTPNTVVYNLEVAGPEHNYFADGILVHNKLPDDRRCGDKNVDYREQCDDGNTESGDGCSSTCKLEGSAGASGAAGSSGSAGAAGSS